MLGPEAEKALIEWARVAVAVAVGGVAFADLCALPRRRRVRRCVLHRRGRELRCSRCFGCERVTMS